MARKRDPQRSVLAAIDLRTLTTTTSDALLRLHGDEYNEIRRAAITARRAGEARFACGRCGHSVYAPREPRTRLPYWQHYRGAPPSCPWWTGNSSTVDAVNAVKFDGVQEGPLHERVKHVVGELLELDELTTAGSVLVDKYVNADGERRRPDVRAAYAGRPIAFEVQLATTQLPVIVAREQFYAREGRHLIWITWDFAADDERPMLTAFEDVYYSHNKNLFSLDDESVRVSRETNIFTMRCFWKTAGLWTSKLVTLRDLHWREEGLPFAIQPEPTWQERWIGEWLGATKPTGTAWETRRRGLGQLAERFDCTADWLEEIYLDDFINLMMSLREGRPIASRQNNLFEITNTFLASDRRLHFSDLLSLAVSRSKFPTLLDRPSVAKKLAAASAYPQLGAGDNVRRICASLFPEFLG
jgi:hypothetical protein